MARREPPGQERRAPEPTSTAQWRYCTRLRLGRARLGAQRFAARGLEHTRYRVHGGGDAHGALHRLALEAVLAQLALVRGKAAAATVDRRHRERQQLEIG